ncbi:MAG: TonB-dependent receptor [Flavobacteriales bacterium]|nr:TonB-dependent receptor [Flavobacteriales bacterium]
MDARKYYHAFLTFISSLALGFTASAQSLQVLDGTSRQPVVGAVLTSTDPARQATSDSSGRVDLAVFPDSAWVRVEHIAFEPLRIRTSALRKLGGPLMLMPRTTELDAFVFSASRFKEARRDVPEQIDVLARKEIAFDAPQSTGDLLQNSGALFVQKSQMGGGSPVIRGFEASRVLLVVDGVRMNNAIYRAGHLQDIMTVDPNALERIEVISGPASVVYGSDALGGVVHLMTRSAPFADSAGTHLFHGGAFTRYSSANNERTAHADVSLSSHKLSSFTSITASDFGDLRQGSQRLAAYPDFGKKPFTVDRINGTDVAVVNPDPDVQTGTGYQQLDVLEKLRFRSGAHTVHQLNLQLSTSSDVPRYDRSSIYSTDSAGAIVPASAEWYYGPQQRLLAAYTLELEGRGFYDQSHITANAQRVVQSRHNRNFGSSTRKNRNEEVTVFGLNADFEKRFAKHELRYGLELTRDAVTSTAFAEDIGTGATSYLGSRYPGTSTMTHAAVYLTHTVELSRKWLLSEGVRLTNVGLRSTFSDAADFQFLNGTVAQDNTAFNWRAGAVFSPEKSWRFTALASTGFRAPNVDDLGKVFDSTPGQVIVPNPDLRPEHTLNVEAGINKIFAERYTLDLQAFHTWYTDALVVAPFTANGRDSLLYDGSLSQVTALVNAGKATITGGSAQLAAKFTTNWSLSSGIMYTYGRVETDSTPTPLDHVPPVYGRTALVYSTKKLHAELYALYNGWKRLADYSGSGEDNLASATPDGMPAWWTLSVRSEYSFSQTFSVQAGVENILDRNYRVFASGVSAPGRNVMVALRVDW